MKILFDTRNRLHKLEAAIRQACLSWAKRQTTKDFMFMLSENESILTVGIPYLAKRVKVSDVLNVEGRVKILWCEHDNMIGKEAETSYEYLRMDGHTYYYPDAILEPLDV